MMFLAVKRKRFLQFLDKMIETTNDYFKKKKEEEIRKKKEYEMRERKKSIFKIIKQDNNNL